MENVPSSIPAEEPPPSSSLAGRLLNVFAAPGDVFDELKTADSSVANWLVPVLIVMLVTITSFAVTLSQPAIKQQVVEMQEKAIDQQVAAGKIKPDQAKAFKEQMAALPPWVMQLFGIVQGVVAGFCGTFWWALVLWLLGKLALKSGIPFLKALEVSGLTMMIFALCVVITTLLIVILGNLMARPALSVFVGEFDPTRKLHLLLGSVNLFYLWSTAVLALALSRLSGVGFGKAAVWMFGFWAASRVLFVVIGLGGFVL
ncbi:MAG: hypothetical protein DME19_06395 [Verrucomicrobia bacterium]|nr:MAG: hypothetical protein DME19_06395 [Verrucomicrobiota bacterium]